MGTLLLTYFLTPQVQGEVSDAFIVVLSAHQMSSFGIPQYLVAQRDAGRDVAWHVTSITTVTGLFFIGLVVLLRGPIGGWLSAPEMGMYVPGLAIAMIIERLGIVPERLLAKRLEFRRIGLGRTMGEIAYSAVSVTLATLHFGGMAIVWGNILRAIVTFVIFAGGVARRDWLTPTPLSRSIMRPMFTYGLPLSVSTFATFASRRWDNLIISYLFGTSVVGEYNLAYNLADIPAVQVGEQIGDVLFPSFSQMEPGDRKRALVRATGLLSLIVFPLAVGLGAMADTIVKVLLHANWQGVAPMLLILSALSVTRPLGWTVGAYLQASQRSRAAMWLGLAKIAFLVGALLTVGRLGPLWACGSVGIAFGLHSLASMWTVAATDGVKKRAFLGQFIPPLLACVPLAAAVVGVREALLHAGVSDHAGVLILAELAAGGAGYLLGAGLLARPVAIDFYTLVRDMIRRRRAGKTDSAPPPGNA